MSIVIHPIDYQLWHQDRAAFCAELGASFQETGFAVINNHQICARAIAQSQKLIEDFFALPLSVKTQYQRPEIGHQRGYAPLGCENAKGRHQGDLKEFWHIGRPPSQAALSDDEILPTPSMQDIEGFDSATQNLFTECDQFGAQILKALALYLDLDGDWFDSVIDKGNSLLRLLHYPAQDQPPPSGVVRSGAHEDINLITLLLGAQEAGLQVKHQQYGWLDVTVPDGAIVLNCGDMLQRLTGGILPSTTHRVANPKAERARFSRYSMPFFLHPKNNFVIKTLPSCVARGGIDYPPISAGDYLTERLIEIGLLSAA